MSILKSHELNVYRKTSGRWVNGKWETGLSDPTFKINTSWQPANSRDLENLPEGKRQSASFKGFPSLKIQTVDQKTLVEEDVIKGPDNYYYRVVFVDDWQNYLLPHYKFICVRINDLK